jgi:hypothetical protein
MLQQTVYEGIPSTQRAEFWVKCSGLDGFKENYCKNYYSKLCEADESEWEQYPNKHFQ